MSKSPQVTAKLGLDNSQMRSSLNSAKRDVGSFGKYAKQSLSTAFKGASIAAGGFVASLSYGINKNMQIENTELALKSFMGSAKKAQDAVAMLRKEASERPIFALGEMMAAGKALSTFAKGDTSKLQELVELAEKLSVLNPEQGLEGAAFSLKEALSGDYVSLIERFNVSRSRINELKAMGLEGQQIVSKILSELGVSEATLDDFGNSFSGMIATIRSTVEEFATNMSKGLFDDMKPRLEDFKNYLADHQVAIQELAVGVATAVAGIVDAGVKTAEVAGVTAAGLGAEFGSYKDDYQSGRMDFAKAAEGFFGGIGSGLGAAAFKFNEMAWRAIDYVASPIMPQNQLSADPFGRGKSWMQEQAEWSKQMASETWARTKTYDEMVNDGLGIHRANAAGDAARAAKAQDYQKPQAQIGSRGTGPMTDEQRVQYDIDRQRNQAMAQIDDLAKQQLAKIQQEAVKFQQEWLTKNRMPAVGTLTPAQQQALQGYQAQMMQYQQQQASVQKYYANYKGQANKAWDQHAKAAQQQAQQTTAYNNVQKAATATLNVNVASNGQVPLQMAATP